MQEWTSCFLQVRHRLLFAANEQGLVVICIALWVHLFFISGFNLGFILQTSKTIEDEHLLWWQNLLTTSLGRTLISLSKKMDCYLFYRRFKQFCSQLFRGLKAEIDEEVISFVHVLKKWNVPLWVRPFLRKRHCATGSEVRGLNTGNAAWAGDESWNGPLHRFSTYVFG